KTPDAHRVLLPEALALADQLGGQLRRAPGALTAEAAGDLRRFTESVDELSLVVATDRPADTLDAARRMPFIAEVTSEHDASIAGRLTTGLPVRILVAPRARYACALLRATGSTRHVEHLERIARDHDTRLDG